MKRVKREITCEDLPHFLAASAESGSIFIELTEQLGFRKWSNTFSAEGIQTLTLKSGASKSVPVFWRMLTAAIEEDSDSVSLNLLTSAQLDEMRTRSGKTPKGPPASDNRYLILTLSGEFDAVNYPLILFPGIEDRPDALHQIILRLQEQRVSGATPSLVESLRSELGFEQREREKQADNYRKELTELLRKVEALTEANKKLVEEKQRPRFAAPKPQRQTFSTNRVTKTFSRVSAGSTKKGLQSRDGSESCVSKKSKSRASVRSHSLQSVKKLADSFIRRKQKLAELTCGKKVAPSRGSVTATASKAKFLPRR